MTTIASYLATGASIIANAPVVDANSAAENYLGILTKKGCLEALLGKYSDAVTTFTKVIALDDSMAQAHLLLAELYLEEGDAIAATEQLVRYSELAPDDNSQLAVICELYYGQNNYRKAIEYGEKVIKSGCTPDMNLYNAIGLSRLLTGDYANAMKDIDKAIELGEKDVSEGNILQQRRM